MKRAVIGALAIIMVCGALPAKAQFEGAISQFIAVNNTQLGNLGFTRYRGFGARAMGMGGAFIALSDDLTATTWNPAGLGQLGTPVISIGGAGSTTDPSAKTYLQGVTNVNSVFFQVENDPEEGPFLFEPSDSEAHLDYLSFGYPVRLSKKWRLGLSASYFTNLIFDQNLSAPVSGYAVNYSRFNQPPGSPGAEPSDISRFEAESGYADQLRSGNLATYSFSGGFNWNTKVYFGFSANYWDGFMDANESVIQGGVAGRYVDGEIVDPTPTSVYSQRFVDLTYEGWSVAFGALFKPIPSLRIGLVYKPSFELDANGCIQSFQGRGTDSITDWSGCGTIEVPEGSNVIPYDFDGGKATYPDTYGLGVAWSSGAGWTITADWSRTDWSKAVLKSADGATVVTFPSLSVLEDFREFPNDDPNADPTDVQRATVGFEQFDAQSIRIGGEYVFLIGSKLRLPLRGGVFFEEAYRNAPGVSKPLDVTGFSLGLGLAIGRHWDIDFAAVYESSSQNMNSEDVFGDLAEAGGSWYRANYDYTEYGSEFKQSSVRLLLNMAYKF